MQSIFFGKRQKLVASFLIFAVLLLFGMIKYLEYQTAKKLEARPAVADFFWEQDTEIALPDKALADLGNQPRWKISHLDGRRYPATLAENVMAIMIENHPASRPQMHGLPEASIVYETLAEGGITRYLAIFGYQDLGRVGPVRSARPYFVDWAEEYGGAAYVHAGGSQAALRQLRSTDLLDLDEDGEIIYRDFRYLTPHNLFVDLGLVKDLFVEKGRTNRLIGEWFDFEGNFLETAEVVSALTLNFGFPSYRVDYAYDEKQGDYERQLGGVVHESATGTDVRPNNIIIQFTSYWPIDDEGRLELTTTGSGEAWYFSGGKFWSGTWSKSAGGRTEFLDAVGAPVSLRPGQTFIEVIDSPERVEIR